MEIVIVWSWFSFIVGVVGTLLVSIVLVLAAAFKQWKNQKKQADSAYEARVFAAWGGRDNSPL